MTYKTAAKQMHFRDQAGSSSVRVIQRGYGGQSTGGAPVEITAKVKQQYVELAARLVALDRLVEHASTAEERNNIRARIRNDYCAYTDLRSWIGKARSTAFDKLFVRVAHRLLPKELIEKIKSEVCILRSDDGPLEILSSQQRQNAVSQIRLWRKENRTADGAVLARESTFQKNKLTIT